MALTCVVCRGEDFDETEEGFYVCHLCGTQSQDVVREVEDEELQFNTAGAGIARGARRVRTPGRRGDALGAARGAGPRDGTYGATPAGPGSREDAQRRVSATSEESRAALGRVVAYCDGLQRLLQAQCDALVQTMGFPESIRLETRKVWLAYLDGSKILETDFADPNAFLENDAAAAERTARSSRARPPDAGTDASASASASSSEEDDDDGTDDDAEELRRSFGVVSDARRDLRRRARRRNEKRVTFRAFVTRRFPVKCTLSLVYLACLRLRLPVHCGDVTLWAADGRLPYLAESARVADAVAARERTPAEEVTKNKNGGNGAGAVDVAARVVAARFAAPLAAALVARSVPKTHLVAAFAARVARVSESGSFESALRFPPTNAAAFVSRFAGALGLGAAFAEQAMRALCLYQAPGLRHARVSRAGAAMQTPASAEERRREDDAETKKKNTREGGVPAPPHAHAAATVVAALKATHDLLAVRLDGTGGGETVETFDETSRLWRLAVLARDRGEPFQKHASDALPLATRADAFFAFCRDHVFGGRSVPPPRDRVVASLWRAYKEGDDMRQERRLSTEFSPTATRTMRRGDENVGDVGDDESRAAPPPFSAKRLGDAKPKRKRNADATRIRDSYWRGPSVLAEAPRSYRAVVETVAAIACVAPEALHACVLDVDAALEARERGLREEKKARTTEAAGKPTPEKRGKKRRHT